LGVGPRDAAAGPLLLQQLLLPASALRHRRQQMGVEAGALGSDGPGPEQQHSSAEAGAALVQSGRQRRRWRRRRLM
jgi:hypothetical protein